jgi:alkylhydroperoxidase family enzyme
MNSEKPRYQPVSDEEAQEFIKAYNIPPQFLNKRFPENLMKLGVNNKPLFNLHMIVGTSLNATLNIQPRQRELLILRCAARIDSVYEWEHHVETAKTEGFTADEIEALKSDEPNLKEETDNILVRACDELLSHSEVGQETFEQLSQHFNTQEIMEIISVVGFYQWTGMMLKSFKVPLESFEQTVC